MPERPFCQIPVHIYLLRYNFRNPNHGGKGLSSLTRWPRYDGKYQRYIRLKGGLQDFPIESHYLAKRVYFWNSIIPLILGTDGLESKTGTHGKKMDSKTGRHGKKSEKDEQHTINLYEIIFTFVIVLSMSGLFWKHNKNVHVLFGRTIKNV